MWGKERILKKYSQFFFDPLVSSFFLPHAMSEILSLPSKYQYFFFDRMFIFFDTCVFFDTLLN